MRYVFIPYVKSRYHGAVQKNHSPAGIRALLGIRLRVSSCRGPRRSAASGVLAGSALAALLLPVCAQAEFLGRAAGTVQYESNSNVFDLEPGFVPAGGSYTHPRADDYFAYGAELTGDYVFGRQNLYSRLIVKQYDYERFKNLDHNEYEFVTRLIYKLTNRMDGMLGVTRTHSMVPFLDLTGSQLSLSVVTQQRENATLDFRLNPAWVLGGAASFNDSSQPSQGMPNLGLQESSGSATLKYTGIGKFTSGIMAGYGSGSYSGSTNGLNPSYSEEQAGLVAGFESKRSIYNGQVGYTRRSSSSGTDNTSGVTGLFDFTYRQTPKTAWRIALSRAVKSYVLASASEIDTDAAAGVSWRASYKLSVSLDYAYSYQEYPGQGLNPVGATRIDHRQQANLGVSYEPQHWILIRPYANIQTRSSSLAGSNSNSTVFGVSITVMTSDQANSSSVPMESHWR